MPIAASHYSLENDISVMRGFPATIAHTAKGLSLLLVDGNVCSLERHQSILSNSGYLVITATTLTEVIALRQMAIRLAVLSETLGWSILRSAAENVRRTWPRARILVLGAAQRVLDDPLYDEAADCQITSINLLSVLQKLSCDFMDLSR